MPWELDSRPSRALSTSSDAAVDSQPLSRAPFLDIPKPAAVDLGEALGT